MGLDEWLEAVRTAADSDLERLGITYDWPILLKGDFDAVVGALDADPKWQQNPEAAAQLDFSDLGRWAHFDYRPGSVSMQVLSWPAPGPMSETAERHIARVGHSVTLLLGHYNENIKEMEGTPYPRTFAHAIADLAALIQQQRLPAYFPRAKGQGMSENPPGVVYEPPPSGSGS